MAKSLRPRESIYDRTGDVRLRLASMVLYQEILELSVQKPTTPGGTLNLARSGNRGPSSPSGSIESWHSVAQFADRKVKWTFRIRVQIHNARNLAHAPRVLDLRRGSMVGFGAGTEFIRNDYTARPAVIVKFSDFIKYGAHVPSHQNTVTEGIVQVDKNGKLQIPPHRTGSAKGLEAPSWSEDNLDEVKYPKTGDADIVSGKNLDNVYMTPALFEDVYE